MIIAVSGPSGIGKGVFTQRLLARYPFIIELPWFTTRPIRSGLRETNRIHLSPLEFEQYEAQGKMLLVQELFGNRYGLPKASLQSNGDQSWVVEIHPDNLPAALQFNPDIVAIGLITPDMSLLEKRLVTIRRTESSEEIQRRLEAANAEMDTILLRRSLYAAVVEITEENQDTAISSALAVINEYFERKGQAREF